MGACANKANSRSTSLKAQYRVKKRKQKELKELSSSKIQTLEIINNEK